MRAPFPENGALVKLLLVLNPHAAAGRAARLLEPIRSALGLFADVTIAQTTGRDDASHRVASADLGDYDGLVAAGGDGTLFEVLNGLYSRPEDSRRPLGVVPVGTGNAFARELGLMPGDWRRAIDIIASGHRKRVDVGHATADGDGFHFLNIIGAGLPVDAMLTARHLKVLGQSAYTLATLWQAMRLHSYPLQLTLDGEEMSQDSMFIEVSNTRYTGTSFLIAPEARFDDGLLDVTLVRRLSRPRLLRLFPSIYSGRHVEYEEVMTRQVREISINAPNGLALVPDGEYRGRTPVQIRCLPRDLEIFAP
jgi:diacylglycerol kinase (ATP)